MDENKRNEKCINFIITVDVEADNQWESNNYTCDNIKFLPRFQELCEKYKFIPSYLVSYEVCEDNKSVDKLKKFSGKGAEIGAHFHPWTVPVVNSIKNYPLDLDDDTLKGKLEVLTKKINDSFGLKPTSYRAGRWGLDDRQAEILKELGYIADCSITPKLNWKTINKEKNAPDFKENSVIPYKLNSAITEVPMTILFTGILKKENSLYANFFNSLNDSFFKKVLNKLLFKVKWLRIFPESNKKDWKKIYKSARKNNLDVLEFMIHSSELMPGASPYAKTERDVERVYKNLEQMFEYFKEKNIKGVTISNYVKNK